MRTTKKFILVATATITADEGHHERYLQNDIELFHALMDRKSPTLNYEIKTQHVTCKEIADD